MAKVIGIMERTGVLADVSSVQSICGRGGGTIAQYVAMMDVDVVDLGVPILSMHAPFELASKRCIQYIRRSVRSINKCG